MSLASFPRAEVVYDVDTSCDPEKIVLTFHKPSVGSMGHDIDRQIPVPTKKRPVRISSPKKKAAEPDAEQLKKFQKFEAAKKFREQVNDRATLKSIYGMIDQKVECACMSTDEILVKKRTRLRELLLAEEVAYAVEYVDMCQKASASREEELYRKAFEVQAKAERERKQFADEKILQQKVMSCDAARPTLTQKQLKELKQDQLWQIKEKYAKEEARREEEKMYHDLMMKNILALKEHEEENAKLAWKKQKNVQKAFIEQMKWKEEKEEQEKRLKEFERVQLEEEVRAFKEAELNEKKELLEKKEKMKAEFREMLERERETKERRRREEEEIERTFNKLLNLEAEKERSKESSNKMQLKREMDLYIEYNKKLKKEQEEEERKCEKIIEEYNEAKRKQKEAERRRLIEARQQLFTTVLKGREEQLKEKQERQRREMEQERAELELLRLQMEQQDKIRQEYERRCAEKRMEYKCQLLRQIEEAEEAKRKKKEEDDAFVKQAKQKEEQEIEEIKAILKALPIFPKEHPMKTLMKGNPPKYPCLHPYM